ncbi:CHAT domain-containing protein [Kitasatospora cineracea]
MDRVSAEEDLRAILEPDALVEARLLSELIEGDPGAAALPYHHLLGWLYAARYYLLPQGAGQEDYGEAVKRLTLCLISGATVEDLPAPLFPVVFEKAMGITSMLYDRATAANDEQELSESVRILRHLASVAPAGGTEHTYVLSNLAVTLQSRFSLGRNPDDLDDSVDALATALHTVRPGDPLRLTLLCNLVAVLHSRFEWTGATSDLDRAIGTSRAAVTEADVFGLDRGHAVHSLAMASKARFDEQGDPTDLDTAIEAFREARVHYPGGLERAGVLYNLGGALRDRYRRSGFPADLEEALTMSRASVDAASREHPGRAMFLSGFASCLLLRFESTGDVSSLNHSIDVSRTVVELVPTGSTARPLRLDMLGNALLARYDVLGGVADLEEAIELHTDAVNQSGAQQIHRNALVNNLATAVWRRFERFGDPNDLNRAINAGRACASATETGHVDRPARLSNVGLMLWSRFKHSGSLPDLDASIEYLRAALGAAPAGDQALPGMLSNLSAASLERWQRTAETGSLDEAVRASCEAVKLSHRGRPDHPRYLANMSVTLQARFKHGGRNEDLEEAIGTARAAASGPSVNPSERARHLNALGASLRTKAERTESAPDLDDAVSTFRTALRLVPEEHPDRASLCVNLGGTLQHRHTLTRSPDDLKHALDLFLEASRSDVAGPSIRIQAARAGAVLVGHTDRALAADLLEEAVRRLPEVASRELGRPDRQHAMGEWSGLAGEAAAAALASGVGEPSKRAARALRLLEAGRGVLLGQTLDTRGGLAELRFRHPDLAARFEELRDLLDHPGDPLDLGGPTAGRVPAHTANASEHRRRLAQELAAMFEQIRALEGFADFARPPTVAELIAQAGPGPVVTYNISHTRSDALLLTSAGIESLPLPDLALDSLLDQIERFHLSLRFASDPSTNIPARRTAQQTLLDVLAWLWNVAAEPALNRLGFKGPPTAGEWPRIWWNPGGILAILPLHAAGHHTASGESAMGEPGNATVMDRVVSSYTPTIRVLHHTRQHSNTARPATRSLIVAMPTTPGPLRRLPHVRAEAERVRTLLPNPTLLIGTDETGAPSPRDGRPTKQRVLEHLPLCEIAHFACHGARDSADPSRSLLFLEDYEEDPFTVASLAELKLGSARLAFLSACRTAFTDSAQLIDEAIHLNSAFQLAGFPHVIGTLWEIDDQLAATVAADFYRRLTTGPAGSERIDTDRAAHALHHTMTALRGRYPNSPYLWAAHLHTGM